MVLTLVLVPIVYMWISPHRPEHVVLEDDVTRGQIALPLDGRSHPEAGAGVTTS